MAGPANGGTRTIAMKRSAGDNLNNGNTKRANTRKTNTENDIIPVAALLHVDFCGLPKLCHRHYRQINNLGNPFDAVERWARRALPQKYWTSNVEVGHWMRSESLGVAYMFRNGYCYDNGREFVTVPMHGRWIEYDSFKCFRSDDGVTEWYSVLGVRWLRWPTDNPHHDIINGGSWTLARHGKPVLLGRDNRFYQSVLDAFRERNPAVISRDKEIDVPRKHLNATRVSIKEAPRPSVREMNAYGDHLRLVRGFEETPGLQILKAPAAPEKMDVKDEDEDEKPKDPVVSKDDRPEHETTLKNKPAAIGLPNKGDQRAQNQEALQQKEKLNTAPHPPVVGGPKLMEIPGAGATKVHQDLPMAGSDRTMEPSEDINMGSHTPERGQILTPAPHDPFAVSTKDIETPTPLIKERGTILKGSPTIVKDRSDTEASPGTQTPSQTVKPQNHTEISFGPREISQAKTNVISKRIQSRTTQRRNVTKRPQPPLKPDIRSGDRAQNLQAGELHGRSEDLSFGIELEFMIPVILEEERDGTDIDAELLPAMNVIPLGPREDPNGESRKKYDSTVDSRADMFIRQWVENKFRTTLIDLGVPVMDPKGDDVLNADPEANSVSADRKYWGWNIGSDPSIRIPAHLAAAYEGGRTRWVSFELKSPAYLATPANLKEIRRVIGGLSRCTKLHFLTPETTGLHVHVGRGRSAFDLGELKRLAGMCYAAGPLLSQLHPPARHENDFCTSNRFYSYMSQGLTMEQCIALRQSKLSPNKPQGNPLRLSPETDESSQRPADTPLFRRMLKRGDLPRDTFQVETFQKHRQFLNYLLDRAYPGRSASHLPSSDNEPRGTVAAINEMWRAPTSVDLVEMFQDNESPNYAYNFMRYGAGDDLNITETETKKDRDADTGKYGEIVEFDEFDMGFNIEDAINDAVNSKINNVIDRGDSVRPSSDGRALTVEFRQAASTLDADSVVAWVRIVVNLACAALHSRLDEYSRLVHVCAKAERAPAWYDAFDLLVDLDMPRTAQLIQTRMLSRPRRNPWADLPADGSAFSLTQPEEEEEEEDDDWSHVE